MPKRGRQVHRGEDREVGRADHVVPEQDDPGGERDEGEDHGGEGDVALQAAHAYSFALDRLATTAEPQDSAAVSHSIPMNDAHGSPPSAGTFVVRCQLASRAALRCCRSWATRSSPRSASRCPSTRGRSRAASAAAVRAGVGEALTRFVDDIERPGARTPARWRPSTENLGAGELRQGRTLEALLAAYRVGRAGRVAPDRRGGDGGRRRARLS